MSASQGVTVDEVMIVDAVSLSSSSTATSDSDSVSDAQEEPAVLFNDIVPEDEEEADDDEDDEPEEKAENQSLSIASTNETLLYVNEVHDLPRSSGSASPLEMQEERSSEFEYPMSQRVFSNPPCKMSAVLQRQSRELLDQFDSIGTEMIVTRRGRRMFPPLKVELFDLDPNASYILLMDMAPVDKYRYKYQNSAWVKCFEEECSPTRLYVHPDSPNLGCHWMNSVINFYKLKLTNNQLDKQGHIIVNSMHKYQPRLHVVESDDISNLDWENFKTFIFPGTQFTTVTAYQNDKITQLKIENNPFAKGFRSPFSRCRTRNQPRTYSLQSNGSDSDDQSLLRSPRTTVIPPGYYLTNTRSIIGQKRKSECSVEEEPVKQQCISPPSSQEVIAFNKSPKVYPISSHATGMPSPPLSQVAPVSTIGRSPGVPVQAPIFIIYAGQQPQAFKNGTSLPNGKMVIPTSGTNLAPNGATIIQASNVATTQPQAVPILNGNGFSPNTQLIISPQPGGIIPSSQGKVDLHAAAVHHAGIINGQAIIQAPPPTLMNLNGTPATIMQPNGQQAIIVSQQQPAIRSSIGNGSISYTNGAVNTSPTQSVAPLIVTNTSNSTSKSPQAISLCLPKKAISSRQSSNPISISHSSITEKRSPPPLVQVKQEVGVIGDLSRVVQHQAAISTAAITTSPTSERHHPQVVYHPSQQPQPQQTLQQVSQKLAVLPQPFITEISSSSPLSTSPPASSHQAAFKASSGRHTSLPYIVLDDKQQREASRQILVQPPPVYRISSTLNNIQPLQIVSQVPTPLPGIALPDLMKRDAPTAH